jgi:uncharacterized protein (DUF2147 family)
VRRKLHWARKQLAIAGACTVAALLLFLTCACAAPADAPTGDWLVEKRWAIIRIVDCGGQLWGVVTWETHPSVDAKNPDPAKRSRPTLGMPILLGMKMSKSNEWNGQIYNSSDGHTYDANISLSAPNVLRVEGCVLGFLCGGEDWTRVTAQTMSLPKGAPVPWMNAGASDSQQVCTGLLGTTGSAHERRLK